MKPQELHFAPSSSSSVGDICIDLQILKFLLLNFPGDHAQTAQDGSQPSSSNSHTPSTHTHTHTHLKLHYGFLEKTQTTQKFLCSWDQLFKAGRFIPKPGLKFNPLFNSISVFLLIMDLENFLRI